MALFYVPVLVVRVIGSSEAFEVRGGNCNSESHANAEAAKYKTAIEASGELSVKATFVAYNQLI